MLKKSVYIHNSRVRISLIYQSRESCGCVRVASPYIVVK